MSAVRQHTRALAALLGPSSVLLEEEPLAKRTTLRVGGRAELLLEPGSELDLSRVMAYCSEQELPVVVLGRGSNLLIRDGGIRGVVITLAHPVFSQIECHGHQLCCGAGARLKTVAVEARRLGLGGFEFLEGIPGSVGGAMRMNAGAMGSWLFDLVDQVRAMDWSGQVIECAGQELGAEYRGVAFFRDHVALGARLQGRKGDQAEIGSRMKEYSERRWATQPAQPSAGCIFKNPSEIPAGKLVEELGLKGFRVGGAAVSSVHGNFIINEGEATARDVLELIELIRARARAERGIELETEVEILGE